MAAEKASQIYMTGLSHSRAGIEVRECFSFTRSEMERALKQLKRREDVSGCVLLSTCNRTELYLSAQGDFKEDLKGLLCGLKGIRKETCEDCLESLQGEEAVTHLFYLAAGLKSQIIGEDQILTQVKEALSFSRELYCSDQILEVLFRMAVTAGKKCKSEISLPRANSSMAGAALELLKKEGDCFFGKKCLVLGNGMMGKLTATLLLEEGAEVTVTIRQYKSGLVDTPRGVKRVDYEKRYEVLADCDYIFSATASPNLTIRLEPVREILEHEKNPDRRKKVFVDLAVPRDIEQGIAGLPGVRFYNVDSFSAGGTPEELKEALQRADKLLSEGIEEFIRWYEAKDMVPRLLELADKAAQDTVWRLQGKLKELPEEERQTAEEAVEEAAKKAAGKLLFGLRDFMDADTLRSCVMAMERKYGEE